MISSELALALAVGVCLTLSANVVWLGTRRPFPGCSAISLLCAYAFTICWNETGFILVGVLGATVVSLLIGLFLHESCELLPQSSFILFSLAAAEIAKRLAYHFSLLTGGSSGLSVSSEIGRLNGLWLLMCSGVAAVGVAYLWNSTKEGAKWRSAGESPVSAQTQGINDVSCRRRAWILASLLAGLAGCGYSCAIHFIHPDDFGLSLGLAALAAGMASRPRSLILDLPIAVTVLFGFREILRHVGSSSERFAWHEIVVGAALAIIVLLAGALQGKDVANTNA